MKKSGKNAKIENIRVCVRMRPLLKHEDREYWEVDQDENNIYTVNYFTTQELNDSFNNASKYENPENEYEKNFFNSLHSPQKFNFDKIYSYNSESQMIYKEICQDIIKSIIDGYNGSIFMYGQTTSGKTFTMLGSSNCPGILPCSLNDIFIFLNMLQKNNKNIIINIYCSYIEIYNEKINDLLNNSNNLKLIDDKKYGTIVCGAKRVKIKNFDQGIAIKDYGEENRKYRETLINEYSSRSHCIFQIYLEQFQLNGKGEVNKSFFSCLNLVDLAGSERINERENKKVHIDETGYINKSLFMLTNVINKLAENSSSINKKIYIPYRDSKLTRLLSQSLGGNSLTTIICTISPASMNYYQTLSTLRFATRAKSVRLQASTNEYFDDKDKIYYYQKEIQKLKDQLRNRNNNSHMNINLNNNNMRFNQESVGQVSQYEYNMIVNAYQNLNAELENYKQLYLKEKKKSERYKAQINGNTNYNNVEDENESEEEENEEDENEEEEEEDEDEEKEIIDNINKTNNIAKISTNYKGMDNNNFQSYNNFKLGKKENLKINNGNNGGIRNINDNSVSISKNTATNDNKEKDEYEQLKQYIRINRNKKKKKNLEINRINSYDAFKKAKQNKPIKTEIEENKNINNSFHFINLKKYNNNKNIIFNNNNYSQTEYESYENDNEINSQNKNPKRGYGYISSRSITNTNYEDKLEIESNGNDSIKGINNTNNKEYDKNEETINAIKNGNVFNMLDMNYNEIIHNSKNPKQLEILKKLYDFKMDALEKTMDYYQSFSNEYYRAKIIEINNINEFNEKIQNKKRTLLNNITDEFKNILNKLKDLHKEKKDELEYKYNMYLKNFSSI